MRKKTRAILMARRLSAGAVPDLDADGGMVVYSDEQKQVVKDLSVRRRPPPARDSLEGPLHSRISITASADWFPSAAQPWGCGVLHLDLDNMGFAAEAMLMDLNFMDEFKVPPR